jgi:hypothetical protein
LLRYLLNNLDWLDDALGAYEDDYLIIDCPGEFPDKAQSVEMYLGIDINRIG